MIPGLKITIMAATLLMLTGCGVVKKTYQEFAPDRNTAYLDARETPPLTVPAGMSTDYANPNTPFPPPHGPLPHTDHSLDVWPPEVPRTNDKPA